MRFREGSHTVSFADFDALNYNPATDAVGNGMRALLGMLLTIPFHAATIEPAAAAADGGPLQREIAPIMQPVRDRLAQTEVPKRTETRCEKASPSSRAKRRRAKDCDPDDRRCEVQRKLGGTVDDRRLPKKGQPMPRRNF
jgi:hypothetical protein